MNFVSIGCYVVTAFFLLLYLSGRIRNFKVRKVLKGIIDDMDCHPETWKEYENCENKIKGEFRKKAPKKISDSVFFHLEQLEPFCRTLTGYRKLEPKEPLAARIFVFVLVAIGAVTIQIALIFGFVILPGAFSGFGFGLVFVGTICYLYFAEIVFARSETTIKFTEVFLALLAAAVNLSAYLINTFILKWSL